MSQPSETPETIESLQIKLRALERSYSMLEQLYAGQDKLIDIQQGLLNKYTAGEPVTLTHLQSAMGTAVELFVKLKSLEATL